MTQPITITTRQTDELHRKWEKAKTINRTLTIVLVVLWGLVAVAHTVSGIMHPNFVLHWVNAGLAFLIVVLNLLRVYVPHWFIPMMTTTVTFTEYGASITMNQNKKTKGYSVDWSKVYVYESSDCYFFQVNFRQMQIFRKEDLTDCTAEELSALLREKIGKRYVKLK